MFVAVDETTAASIRRPANTPLINSVSVTKVGQDRRNDKQYLQLSRLERHIRPDTDSCHELVFSVLPYVIPFQDATKLFVTN